MAERWNLEQLRLFVRVAELRSFSAVAREQRKAQSAVSSAIALLEADLGVGLFDRSSGRQPRLSESGAALLGGGARLAPRRTAGASRAVAGGAFRGALACDRLGLQGKSSSGAQARRKRASKQCTTGG